VPGWSLVCQSGKLSLCPGKAGQSQLTWIQTSGNSCASVALLNIVNNIPTAELGLNLAQFKEFTRDFPPALRGNQIDNFEFLKSIHNSFAR
jgi:hypothetical protein